MLRNPFKTYRINAVFFFSSAALIALLIGIVITISYNGTSSQIEQNTSYYQQRLLNELSKKLNTSLIGVEQTSNTAAKNFDLLYGKLSEGGAYERARLQSEIREQMNYLVYGTTILQSIHVYSEYPFTSDTQGPVTFIPMDQLSREPWYSDIRDSDSAWLKEHTILVQSREVPVISFARKVFNNSNQYYGLMVFNIKVSNFKQLISTENDTVNIALLNSADKLITHSGSGEQLLSAARALDGRMEQPSGSLRDGNEFYVWAKSPDSQWTLLEATSWTDMTRGTREMARLFILLGVTTILLVFLITLLLSHRFMKPMNQLLRAMGQYTIGEEQRLPVDYSNEFGRLFQGYRKLTVRIEELYESLRVQHQRQREAELKSLQMMINPHFLYNTLDQINWMAIEARQNKISLMLAELAGMFRLALTNPSSLVTVKEEVAHIECYLKFQQVRWEERLCYTLSVDPDVLQVPVPKIMLQPFIENAFMHGFHGKRQAELHIRIFRTRDWLHVEILDNGKGLAKDWQSKPRKRGGYGLRNVKERLDALYGSRYVLELSSGKAGTGVKVLIQIPIEHQEMMVNGGTDDVENSDRG